jgi:FAD/FMN-containing dehydrogenase
MQKLEELKNLIKGEIETADGILDKYSRDASVFEIKPTAVVHPKNTEDLKAIVKWVSGQKEKNPEVSITARSAGTDMSGGAVNDSLILDFTTHFNKIIKIEHNAQAELKIEKKDGRELEIDGGAEVEPGVFYRDFEKETLAKNLILPCYTASKMLNTVGGMAANNSAGEKTLSYGQTKDWVRELDVVLSNGENYTFGQLTERELEQKLKLTTFEGEVYRKMFQLIKNNYDLIMAAKPKTSKNSAGYLLWEVWDKVNFNLAKIFVGSQGTLGLINKVKFNLTRPKPKSELLVIFMQDLKILGDVVHTVVQHKPESFESFDDHTFSLAMRFLPDMLKKMSREAGSAFGGTGSLISLGLQFLPEVWMTLTGGVPKLILIAEFTGDTEEEIKRNMQRAQKEVEEKYKLKTHITKSMQEASKYWTVRRESFSLLRQHSAGLATAPFIDDIVVRPHQLPEFLPKLNAILAKYPSLIYTIAGHAGDANFHIIPLMDLSKESEREIIPKLSEEVYGLVLEYKGSITAEHNDGLIRTPFLEKMYGTQITDLFSEVKNIFDPKGIFNPHKKVNCTMEYSMSKMKKHL